MDRLSESHPVWVEKTPSHIYYLSTIFTEVPTAKVVEVVRDPRDVVSSRKTRRSTVWNSERYTPEQRFRKHLLVAHHPIWDALAWKAAIQASGLLDYEKQEALLRIRYEDLVSRPEEVLETVCAFLGVSFDPGMLSVGGANPADPRAEAQYANRIVASSMTRWKKTLNSREAAIVQFLTKREMKMLGYREVKIGIAARLWSHALWVSAAYEGLRRLNRRRRASGLRYMLRQIESYFRRFAILAKATLKREERG